MALFREAKIKRSGGSVFMLQTLRILQKALQTLKPHHSISSKAVLLNCICWTETISWEINVTLTHVIHLDPQLGNESNQTTKTAQEQLEEHEKSQNTCERCHNKPDPWILCNNPQNTEDLKSRTTGVRRSGDPALMGQNFLGCTTGACTV